MFQHDNATHLAIVPIFVNTGVALLPTVLGVLAGLVAMWEYEQADTLCVASPIVVGDRLYGASCLLDPPNTYGAVFCLNAETGAELWYADLKDPDTEDEFKGFFSSPAIANGVVYIGSGVNSDKRQV